MRGSAASDTGGEDSEMRSRRAAVLAAGCLAVAAAPANTSAISNPGPVAHAACMRATIGGQSRCIARGQYCARRYQRDYRRYGFSCSKRDSRGRYHLT